MTFDAPTPGSLADLQAEADPESVARSIVLRRLTSAPRTRADLAATLAKRGIPDDVAVKVLDRFEEVGLIDDVAYAALLVESRSGGRGLAGPALRAELKRKGVPDEISEAALADRDPQVQYDAAIRLVRSRWKSVERFDEAMRNRRLLSYLQRRGYSYGEASRAIREVSEESDLDS